MTIQQILDTGVVEPGTETPVLLEAQQLLRFQIEQRKHLLSRIERLLKGPLRYGSDEMTPLSG